VRAASLGVSYHTVDRYVDILEQAFLIRKLRPYANLGKRLVKSPKLYFRDSGLLHYFLGIRSASALETHPARGASFEAFLVDQLVSAYSRIDPLSRFWFWRTAQGDEVDLLIESASRLVPFEVKLHSTPGPDEARSLRRCMQDLKLSRGYIVHPGEQRYSLGHGVAAVPAAMLLASPARLGRL